MIVGLFYASRTIFVGLFLALILSSGIDPVITWMQKKGLPRTIGVTLVFLFLILFVVLLVYAIVPRLVIDLNSILLNLRSQPALSGWTAPFLDLSYANSIESVFSELSRRVIGGDTAPVEFLAQALGGLGLAMGILVSAFYLSLNQSGVDRFIRIVMPKDYEETILRIYERSRNKVAIWFRTQIILSVFVGTVVWASMSILGVKHAILLGFLAGTLEIIPFVGPIVAGAVAVVSALTVSTSLAIITSVVFIVIQQVEAHLFVPVVMRRSVGLHPVMVITALLIGAQLEGILGVLIAVPAAAVFQEVVEDWSSRRQSQEN
jgi:predicted PurR-regulated permease PerM